ncbi:MAG: hypothetical protein R3Y67_02695 [Eubacteriales bacterium]
MDNNQLNDQGMNDMQANQPYVEQGQYSDAPVYADDSVQPQVVNQSAEVPQLEEPVSMGEWMISLLIISIPCVGLIMMFVWAFNKSEKKSKSNYFKAALLYAAIMTAVYVLFYIGMFVIYGAAMFASFQ